MGEARRRKLAESTTQGTEKQMHHNSTTGNRAGIVAGGFIPFATLMALIMGGKGHGKSR
ncbi:hypothetical protein [Gordoniibacillus kamchatkensis]|uniref:hypothetical protein n=1 Tax=Gordoniibacillus kamchatkensis TaxID=1590651 RepID=UPI000B08032D|nr:hypothetical protein [Paenibacillus sp. VKM B-2647]